ncbi:MAG TPA: malto-oligosyltrehalose trehalohydrolase [Candidatus Binatia bacterium]|nr:malto-oligosyltrehalose trehalohydrolase [Candidatus Binatia bacterium]
MKPEERRCGAIGLADGAVCWRVWAPLAKQVDLVLIHPERRHALAMTAEGRGYFSHTEADIAEGQRYAYRLDGGPERPDPASRWQPDGVHHSSAVLKTENFVWSDNSWVGVSREELVFYELHVGTFTPEGTSDAIIPRLATLQELGITAVELMPVGQFAGTRNWGYDGVHPYAPQNSYGGPHGLQRLIDACHAHGLAIFLDVVYNHAGPEGSYFSEFGPYFTDRYRTPWGRAINYDGRGSDAVREYVLDNVRMWVEDYHIDGLRLDAVHAIYDFGARHILRDVKDAAHAAARGRHVHVVAESDLNDVRLILPPERGGYGLDAQWSDDFHHTVHARLTGERNGYYEDFGDVQLFPKLLQDTFVFDGCYSRYRGRSYGAPAGDLAGDRFVVCIQNHDQVGNRALGERLGTLIGAPAQRLAASLLLLAPHLPLLFMGEEYGEEQPFQFFCSFSDAELIENVRSGRRREFEAFNFSGRELPDPQSELTFERSRLTWSWEKEPCKAGLRRLYQDLLSARQVWPAMRNFSQRAARLLLGREPDAILELTRGGDVSQSGKTLQVYFNLTSTPQPYPLPRDVELLWSSESEKYDGRRRAGTPRNQLLPYESVVWGPPSWQRY